MTNAEAHDTIDSIACLMEAFNDDIMPRITDMTVAFEGDCFEYDDETGTVCFTLVFNWPSRDLTRNHVFDTSDPLTEVKAWLYDLCITAANL